MYSKQARYTARRTIKIMSTHSFGAFAFSSNNKNAVGICNSYQCYFASILLVYQTTRDILLLFELFVHCV